MNQGRRQWILFRTYKKNAFGKKIVFTRIEQVIRVTTTKQI